MTLDAHALDVLALVAIAWILANVLAAAFNHRENMAGIAAEVVEGQAAIGYDTGVTDAWADDDDEPPFGYGR